MIRVTVTEFVRGFADFINRVVYQGEHLVLVRQTSPGTPIPPPLRHELAVQ